jgi:hypothetical protein
MIAFHNMSTGDNATELTNYLTSSGIPTFSTDMWCASQGSDFDDWQKANDDGVFHCRYFIILMNSGWQRSIQRQEETENAFFLWRRNKSEKIIIPVLYEDFDKSHDEDEIRHRWMTKFKTIHKIHKKNNPSWMDQIRKTIHMNVDEPSSPHQIVKNIHLNVNKPPTPHQIRKSIQMNVDKSSSSYQTKNVINASIHQSRDSSDDECPNVLDSFRLPKVRHSSWTDDSFCC